MTFIIADRVKETTTSVGTSDITLAGAMTGFKTFASRCAVGDTLYYAIQGVDGTGTPTAEWECGLGTYSSANTLTRTTVTASSNADTAVNFSAGTKQVYITMPAVQVAWVRDRLTADRTYYVRTDGNDSNTGLANTSGGAFLTIQKAIDAVAGIDTNIYTATIQVADGTYTGANTLKRVVGAGAVVIQGNAGTPGNVIISTTSAHCFNSGGHGSTIYTIKDMKLQTTTSGKCLRVVGPSPLHFSNIVFGACANSHIQSEAGAVVSAIGNYSISGNAIIHIDCTRLGYVSTQARTVTFIGTPNFTGAYAYVNAISSYLCGAMTFSGSATGSRYNLATNAVLDTQTGNTSYLPGNSAGTSATGAQYL